MTDESPPTNAGTAPLTRIALLCKSDRYIGVACERKSEIIKKLKTNVRPIESGGPRQARTRAHVSLRGHAYSGNQFLGQLDGDKK
jgi:hypothetical protein